MYSALVLLLLFTSSQAEGTPIEQLIKEAIYEADQYLVKEHLDEKEVTRFSYVPSLFQVDVTGGRLGNFSTMALVGLPVVNQTYRDDSTSYNFEMAVGLIDLELELRYTIKILKFFSSSGVVVAKNTGNALQLKGVINTYPGSIPCEAKLGGADLESLGSLKVSFEPWGIGKWLLGQFMTGVYHFLEPHMKSRINQEIQEIVMMPEFQTKFSELACKPFNI